MANNFDDYVDLGSDEFVDLGSNSDVIDLDSDDFGEPKRPETRKERRLREAAEAKAAGTTQPQSFPSAPQFSFGRNKDQKAEISTNVSDAEFDNTEAGDLAIESLFLSPGDKRFVDLKNEESNGFDDFVIIDEGKRKIWPLVKSAFRWLFGLMFIAAVGLTVFVGTQFKFVSEDVVGAEYTVGSISLVPNSYHIDTQGVSVGDTVLIENNGATTRPGWLMVSGYQKVTIVEKTTGVITAVDDSGKEYKFPYTGVLYKIAE